MASRCITFTLPLHYRYRSFKWESLSVKQYRAFESLFRQYHTAKGGLRYASALPADSSGGGLSFLSKLWRGRKVAQGEEWQQLERH